VIPAHFPQWKEVMDNWGNLMMQSVRVVAEMAAIGLGLDSRTFLDLLDKGPHLLAPTGSDFNKFNKLDTILAGFHYDLNFLTIHGKSRFPGLYIWLRDGSRVLVRVPDGCLLLQAGMQLEWLTGGVITAGFHEVVVAPETLQTIEKAKAAGKSLWRVSSTLFSHVASDKTLQPIPQLASPEAKDKYPPILAGKQVELELSKIKLAAPSKV
jgi:isopenicillin N synthase-like dioxygenase